MLSKERRELLDRLVAANTTMNDLQKKHGFNHATIRKYYPDYRKNLNHGQEITRRIQESEEVIAQLGKERAPGTLIAEAVGISPRALKKYRPDLIWSKQEAAEFAAMVSKMTRIKGV